MLKFREPIEVYEAALGNTEPLAKRIESGVEIYQYERDSIAAYIRGELVPPKLKRGEKTVPYLNNTKNEFDNINMKNAVCEYHYFMRLIKKSKGNNNDASKCVTSYIANKRIVDEEKLINNIRRSKISKLEKKTVITPIIIQNYHKWLHITGKLPNYQKYMHPAEMMIANLKPTPPHEIT